MCVRALALSSKIDFMIDGCCVLAFITRHVDRFMFICAPSPTRYALQELSNLVWSLAHLGARPQPEFYKAFFRASFPALAFFNPQVSACARACALVYV